MTIKEYAIQNGGDFVYKCKKSWKGYTVYEICYNEHAAIGLPRFILVKDGKMRISKPEECFKIMDTVIDE